MFAASICLLITGACSGENPKKSGEEARLGEELFKLHCAVCHPNGENVINKDKNLHKEDLEEHGIKTPEDIVKLMRNPGPGMSKFDEKTISDKDAKDIAKYILKKFK
jgi:cytochrome c6